MTEQEELDMRQIIDDLHLKVISLEDDIKSLNKQIFDIHQDKASRHELQRLREQILELKEFISDVSNAVSKLGTLTQSLITNNRDITEDVREINCDIKKIQSRLLAMDEMKDLIRQTTENSENTATMVKDFMTTSVTYRLSQTRKEIDKLGTLIKGKSKVHKFLWYFFTIGLFSLFIISITNYIFLRMGSDQRINLESIKFLIDIFK